MAKMTKLAYMVRMMEMTKTTIKAGMDKKSKKAELAPMEKQS